MRKAKNPKPGNERKAAAANESKKVGSKETRKGTPTAMIGTLQTPEVGRQGFPGYPSKLH